MAEIPNQPDPNEATEAKLCAYLDGQLSPTERAEIEEYLKNYPQHRQTLKDLAATRQVLQTLPRETAPPEVSEAFHGHMERSMLLDGPTNIDSMVRMNHWPQVALAAAIVVLAVGLGIVVYIILPGPVQKYSVAPPPPATLPAPTIAAVPSHAIEPEKPELGPAVVAAIPTKAMDEKSKTPAPPPQSLASVAGTSLAEDQRKKENNASTALLGLEDGSLDKTITDRLTQAGVASSASDTVCLVVHTDDPISTSKQVRSYFATNSIPYQTIGDVDKSGDAGGGLMSSAANEAFSLKVLPTSQPAISNGATTREAKNIPASQPVLQAQVQDRNREMNQNAMQLVPDVSSLPSDNPLFVARAMTRQEAVHLSAVLSTEQPGQTTNLYLAGNPTNKLFDDVTPSPTTQALAALVPSTLPTTEPTNIAIGDRLTISVAQLVGPGVDKTNTVRVADNGTISLPMIEPLPAAGERPADLQAQIATKYKEANLIPDATVTVAPAATTQPTDAAKAPTTNPTEPEKVDVVIVIQKNPPTTEPTTPLAAPKGP
jgi:hypothetical protein